MIGDWGFFSGERVWSLDQSSPPIESLERLFMPDGQIPLPAVVPDRARTAGNLFNVKSLKLGREDLFYDSELEWLHGKGIEMNSRIEWFCEHYPRAAVRFGEKIVVTVFVMLIRFKDGTFMLKEVKYVADSKPQRGTRVYWQLKAQETLAMLWGVPYKIADEEKVGCNELELDNMQRVTGWLLDVPPEALQSRVIDIVKVAKICPIGELVKHLSPCDESTVIMTICFLLHRGELEAPLSTVEFGNKMPIWSRGYEAGIPPVRSQSVAA